MTRRRKMLIGIGAAAAVAVAAGAGVTIATGMSGDDDEAPITGPALEKASAAALAYTGGGRVTETEVGDEESLYEVEVTLDDGRQIDVQLDENFAVVGSEADERGDDTDGDDG